MESISLGACRVFNAFICTSKQPRKGIVLKGGLRDRRRREGSVMKDALFSPFFTLRGGQGFKSRREAHSCHNDRL